MTPVFAVVFKVGVAEPSWKAHPIDPGFPHVTVRPPVLSWHKIISKYAGTSPGCDEVEFSMKVVFC